jgi:hypothetical protein
VPTTGTTSAATGVATLTGEKKFTSHLSTLSRRWSSRCRRRWQVYRTSAGLVLLRCARRILTTDGATPAYVPAARGHAKVVKVLLRAKADLVLAGCLAGSLAGSLAGWLAELAG